jgi:hypothetical protein
VKRRVGAGEIDLSGIRHFVDDLIEDEVYAMIGLEPELYPNEETFFWNDRVHNVLAGERVVNGVHVNEPVYVCALRTFFEDGINDV